MASMVWNAVPLLYGRQRTKFSAKRTDPITSSTLFQWKQLILGYRIHTCSSRLLRIRWQPNVVTGIACRIKLHETNESVTLHCQQKKNEILLFSAAHSIALDMPFAEPAHRTWMHVIHERSSNKKRREKLHGKDGIISLCEYTPSRFMHTKCINSFTHDMPHRHTHTKSSESTKRGRKKKSRTNGRMEMGEGKSQRKSSSIHIDFDGNFCNCANVGWCVCNGTASTLEFVHESTHAVLVLLLIIRPPPVSTT